MIIKALWKFHAFTHSPMDSIEEFIFMDATKRFTGRQTVEILSAAEFNDVGNAYHQGKGLTLWCGGREVEAPTTWQVAIFWIQG